jgi:hypothetical protein
MASDKVNYREVGVIAQAIKHQIREGEFWEGMGGPAKESLDQIATAIARMVAGDGTHWDAIISYAYVAKPGTDEPPTVDLDIPRTAAERAARQSGVEAIERSMRSIPARNDHG